MILKLLTSCIEKSFCYYFSKICFNFFRMKAKKELNQLRTEEQNNKRLKRQLKKLQNLKQKLEEAGIKSDINMDSFKFRKSNLNSSRPTMEVDLDDSDIKLKTPPNVRKVKSATNSRVNSAVNSGANSLIGTPKHLGKKSVPNSGKKSKKQVEQLSMGKEIAHKLMEQKKMKKKKQK